MRVGGGGGGGGGGLPGLESHGRRPTSDGALLCGSLSEFRADAPKQVAMRRAGGGGACQLVLIPRDADLFTELFTIILVIS